MDNKDEHQLGQPTIPSSQIFHIEFHVAMITQIQCFVTKTEISLFVRYGMNISMTPTLRNASSRISSTKRSQSTWSSSLPLKE